MQMHNRAIMLIRKHSEDSLFYLEVVILQDRIVLLVDLDYFFAQCEELRDSSIKDKPVVVCVYSGRSPDSGAVSTANYIARKYGVKSGMPIFQAKKKLESVEAVFLPVDHVFYDQISEKVMNILRSHSDHFEQVGVDEAYLDVTHKALGDFAKASELAQRVKDDLKVQLNLSCSVGVGPNKLVAKIASDTQKPDGLTVIRPEQVRAFLSPLPVDRLIGVGTKTKERMQAIDINTVSDLAARDVQKMIAIFGKTLGTYFHNAALGIDNDPVQEKGEADSISKIATLKQDTRDLNFITEKTDQLCNEIHSTAQQQNIAYKTVGIILITTDLAAHTRSKTLENSTRDIIVLKKIVKELFEKLLNETPLEARRVGVKISNLVKEETSQKQLTSFIKPE
jgi:DNA polymerase IV (DinB-like DNA polymerase)